MPKIKACPQCLTRLQIRILEKVNGLRINPNAKVGMEYNWDLGKVWINLSWNDMDKNGFLTYTYLPIQKEFMRDEKKAAEKTRDNL
jgi:hypothetical protein